MSSAVQTCMKRRKEHAVDAATSYLAVGLQGDFQQPLQRQHTSHPSCMQALNPCPLLCTSPLVCQVDFQPAHLRRQALERRVVARPQPRLVLHLWSLEPEVRPARENGERTRCGVHDCLSLDRSPAFSQFSQKCALPGRKQGEGMHFGGHVSNSWAAQMLKNFQLAIVSPPHRPDCCLATSHCKQALIDPIAAACIRKH